MLVVVVLVLVIIVVGVAILLFTPSETYAYDFECQEVQSEPAQFVIDDDSESDVEEFTQTQSQEP